MDEEKCDGGVGDSSRVSSKFVKSGDRQMFTVELRPGETTIVSWKKLVKDANKVNGLSSSASVSELPANAHPALESRIAPGQPTENEGKDEAGPNRFSAVIEKIERLYMGKDSSDEGDPSPDDDQYDTEDSFIDDAELDEYFEVDDSAIKHDGFFVNRGKLERMSETSVLPDRQLKKRRRKDLEKGHAHNVDGGSSSKHVKLGKTVGGKTTLIENNVFNPPQNTGTTTDNFGDVKLQSQPNASGLGSRKKSVETKMTLDSSPSLKVNNGDTSLSLSPADYIDQQKASIVFPKNVGSKPKESIIPPDNLHHKYHDRSGYVSSKLQFGRSLKNLNQTEPSSQLKERNGIRELPDMNLPAVKYSTQTAKTSHAHRKDGSVVRPKSSMLEKAIRDLERMVAESRPPAMENQEADTSSQATKRRLPREIKQKLAKVARLAASQGKLSKELINRLMSILGHLIQLRTLKRNLKIMISMGVSAKQEKDKEFQLIKKEVVEMIKMQPLDLEAKALEKQARVLDDFQEFGSEDRAAPKKKFTMDAALEEKICDLYDLFVDGLDEESGPQIRKLYAELAELWPNGFMDKNGIKRAICRAKERRRALHSKHKEQEKLKRKKMLATKTEENIRAEGSTSTAQPLNIRDRLPSESAATHPLLSSVNKSLSASTIATARIPSSSMNTSNSDRIKPEKLKGSSNSSIDDARVGGDSVLIKKKVKRKPEPELEGEERHSKPIKPSSSSSSSSGLILKPSFQPATTVPPSLEQSS